MMGDVLSFPENWNDLPQLQTITEPLDPSLCLKCFYCEYPAKLEIIPIYKGSLVENASLVFCRSCYVNKPARRVVRLNAMMALDRELARLKAGQYKK